ncbi:fungal specific transcription factor domain-containing protein [Aspergillus ibericus CBS 121593]|uniref:Transcription factor domain-containing protein n=1 Tax=Aspergillus ibericus CBS 121593 TaxID=1448316 RepID=A0A395HCY3_9EURO|nr:hypothetical protein BO80DRAFT_441677 [Aspergillus ibericus CBS 121593]RAL04828.1 hypothetical protein BO80DRAFT_441677 [Aspergillus ibericus CBS 121593]
MSLLCTSPSPSSDGTPLKCQSAYLQTKGWMAVIEGLGIISLPIVQARTLITLFEVAHGFYPAAYLSIGTTVRAAEALTPAPSLGASPSTADEAERNEVVLLWGAIRVLDRYITVRSGPRPSLTRSLPQVVHDSNPTVRVPSLEENRSSPLSQFSRMVDASALLDSIHNVLHNPTSEQAFNVEEMQLFVETLHSLRTLLVEEIDEADAIYSGALDLCHTGLLLVYENGTTGLITDGQILTCHVHATLSLSSLLTTITDTVSPLVTGIEPVDLDRLPPFIMYLVYKAARIVTERFRLESDSREAVRKLRILRGFLELGSARWLCCRRYLDLLNEDTTPRILKAVAADQ